jgi:hypothetical protein
MTPCLLQKFCSVNTDVGMMGSNSAGEIRREVVAAYFKAF